MNTYTYELINLFTVDQHDDRPKDVVRVLATVTATNEAGAQQTMNCMFNLGPSDTFTPFDQLTDEQVRQWVDASDQWPYYKRDLDNILSATPIPQFTQETLPWLPTPDDVLADYLANPPDDTTDSLVVADTMNAATMISQDEHIKNLIRQVLAESSSPQA
jgi:hypothetical protein